MPGGKRMKYRVEKDSMGEVKVVSDKYWGAQTQRSLLNFPIGPPGSMPLEIIRAFGQLKKAAAWANHDLGLLSEVKRDLISAVCDEIVRGELDDHFPLVVWQTGSGTQTNMNVNEVIVNRARELAVAGSGSDGVGLHPNDDVNCSQSSNDTFPTAMHLAANKVLFENTIPGIRRLRKELEWKSRQFDTIVKLGRTHLMDATPLTLGQEFSGYVEQLDQGISNLEHSLPRLRELAIGGTAVGTGLNCPEGFDVKTTGYLAESTGIEFVPAGNKFAALAGHDPLTASHGALRGLAVSLTKIANDIRLLSSGPRGGLGELILPANEPGSSIMPGKVNPTQVEALTMVCLQVMANDLAVSMGSAWGQLELNVYKPLIITNFLQSATLLGDVCRAFAENCVKGILPDQVRIDRHLENSLMLVTALTPHIGYDRAARIAVAAHEKSTSLREEAIRSGWITAEQYDRWVVPAKMTGR